MMHGHERSITQIKYNTEGDLLFSCAKEIRRYYYFFNNIFISPKFFQLFQRNFFVIIGKLISIGNFYTLTIFYGVL